VLLGDKIGHRPRQRCTGAGVECRLADREDLIEVAPVCCHVPFVISGAIATSTTLTTFFDLTSSPEHPGDGDRGDHPLAATGTVLFRDESTPIGSPVTVSNGTASQSTTLTVGPHQLTAVCRAKTRHMGW
jgi:hypothetical protein